MKNKKSQHRQVSHHAYSTYIKASNQAIRDQNPIQKGTNTKKVKRNYARIKKNSQKIVH